MAVPANKATGDAVTAAEWNNLATTANNGESSGAAATTTANSALTTASAKYSLPGDGKHAASTMPTTVVTSPTAGVVIQPIAESAYVALGTKAANTLYVRTGA